MLVKVEILTTADASKTLHLPELNEQYHSKHGALTEAEHVYIKAGLQYCLSNRGFSGDLNVFELGFGTAMNAALTATYLAQYPEIKCSYNVIDPFILSPDQYRLFSEESWALQVPFLAMHEAPWGEVVAITPNFSLFKIQTTFEVFEALEVVNLVYYDAFGPRAQPQLWEPWALQKCADLMKSEAVWVSYCAKGSVRRGLQEAGLTVERLVGPPGKREMLRACTI
jgi:tRNA U34 5-methylaminomethyl-2-thiouridine-forming methyltransferase MnmC